ncbi:hypothetical protein DXG01_016073 [Tephrocybe rancida]|nr:hypothetical protein DXG01_016073 [Tephrocybe rancida]
MVGNDANADALQLGERITGITEVATILAKHPEWDRAPRRLRLLQLDKNGIEIHSHVDHAGPATWKADVHLNFFNLQTSWKLGRMQIETKSLALIPVFESMSAFDMFSPFGKDLVKAPRDSDDIDDTIDNREPDSEAGNTALGTELEDAAAKDKENEKFEPSFNLNGTKAFKSRYLSQAFEKYRKTGSTDRLKHVASIDRYAIRETQPDIVEHDEETGEHMPCMDIPTATLFRCEKRLFVCIEEVIDIMFNSKHVNELDVQFLNKPSVPITYQQGPTHKVSGHLVEPINPSVCTRVAKEPVYLLESRVLMALGPLVLERVTVGADTVSIPEMRRSDKIPYHEVNGKACFLVEDDLEERGQTGGNICVACVPVVVLPKSALSSQNQPHGSWNMRQAITTLTRIFRPPISRVGCVLVDVCIIYLKRERGTGASDQIDIEKSTCVNKIAFNYAAAAISTTASPRSTVPLHCPVCPSGAPAVWRYNLLHHLRNRHPTVSPGQYKYLYEISEDEKVGLKPMWTNRHRKKLYGEGSSTGGEGNGGNTEIQASPDNDWGNNSSIDGSEEYSGGGNDYLFEGVSCPVIEDTDYTISDEDRELELDNIQEAHRASNSTLHSLNQTATTSQPDVLASPIPRSNETNPSGASTQPASAHSVNPAPEGIDSFNIAETTRAGRRRKAKGLTAILGVRTCGNRVSEEEMEVDGVSIAGRRKDFATQWYVKAFNFAWVGV